MFRNVGRDTNLSLSYLDPIVGLQKIDRYYNTRKEKLFFFFFSPYSCSAKNLLAGGSTPGEGRTQPTQYPDIRPATIYIYIYIIGFIASRCTNNITQDRTTTGPKSRKMVMEEGGGEEGSGCCRGSKVTYQNKNRMEYKTSW